MALTITTYTGAHFAPTEPAPEGVRIQDVAHALSLLCRGNGHVKQFFRWGSTACTAQERLKPGAGEAGWRLRAFCTMQAKPI